MKRIYLKRILLLGTGLALFSLIVGPALSAPLEGVQGSKVQAYFMSQDPDPADAGKDVDLRWQIVNTVSGTIDNLKFHLDADYPFLFEAGDSPDKELGPSAGTNDNKVFYVLHYRLRVADNALKGTYNVTLRWNTGNGWVRKDFPIYIDPKRSDFVIGALVTSPEKLIADTDEAKLSVNIDNIGKGNAENVKVRLLMPESFRSTYSYSDEDSLGTIEEGGSKQADFYVDIDENVREGEYKAKLEISYKDENDETNTYRTQTLDLNIPVKPAPHLIIDSVTSIPKELKAGNKGEIIVKVSNIGNEKAESVSLRVFKDTSQPFEFSEKSDFIGKLEPGDYGEAVIRFDIDTTAVAKKYLLDVELRGIDDKDNVVIFRRTLPLIVSPETSTLPLGTSGIVGGFIAIISIVIGTYYFRNGKENKPPSNQ